MMGYRPSSGLQFSLLTSAFIHASWPHLVANLAVLVLTAPHLENRWGSAVYGPFYLASALTATMTVGALAPASDVVVVGAQGAVAASVGAFLVQFRSARLELFPWLPSVPPIHAKAYFVLPLWVGLLALVAILDGGPQVAHSSSAGGLCFGLISAGLMLAVAPSGQRPQVTPTDRTDDDPRLLAALDAIALPNLVAARAELEGLLHDRPDHLEALVVLARLLAQLGDVHAAATRGSAALDRLCTHSPGRALELFEELTALHGEIALSASALAHTARAAAGSDRPAPQFDATRRLLIDFPDSPLVPQAMLEAAEAQRRHGRPDLAVATLQNLREVFPASPEARRAEQTLTSWRAA